jgi:hypothetical protein
VAIGFNIQRDPAQAIDSLPLPDRRLQGNRTSTGFTQHHQPPGLYMFNPYSIRFRKPAQKGLHRVALHVAQAGIS